jgi:selenide, water dikinase
MEREEQESAVNSNKNKAATFAGTEALDAIKATPMRCGGCGAKVGSTILSRVMKRLEPLPTHPNVLLGVGDDAAMVETSQGKVSVQTVDFFRSFIEDPYVFGQIAAVHALGDIWAMNADPVCALATVVVPFGIETQVEETLFQLMAGACDALRDAGCALGGGHSGEGAELSLGFSITGEVEKESVMKKTSVENGQVLILTKPLGTGALFAADMRSIAKASDVQKALTSMRQPSKRAAEILFLHGATACTDVTGFGILGHLVEMLKASTTSGATLDLATLPILDGVTECIKSGITSSLQKSNVRLNRAIANIEDVKNCDNYAILFDPQTAGGMLATVPESEAEKCIQKLKENGYASSSVVGRIVPCDDTGVGLGRVFIEDVSANVSFKNSWSSSL